VTPYEIFVEAVKENPNRGFREAWIDFAIWERTRGYADDPSSSSKDALAWVRALDDLVLQLDQFDGIAKENCRNALESAFVAFARLNHTRELCDAIQRWRKWRLAETAESSTPLGSVPKGIASEFFL
jgi:hypothetical protein